MEKQFIDQLTTIPLTQRQYAAAGFVRHEIQWRICRYYVARKPHSRRMTANAPLLRAVSNYELQHLDIGPIYFDEHVTIDDDYFKLGGFDKGILCLSRHDHTVRIIRNIHHPASIYNTDRLCAAGSNRFLEALIPAAIYLEKCMADPTLYEMEQMQEAMISYCAGLAGNDTAGFFRVLLEGPANGVFR